MADSFTANQVQGVFGEFVPVLDNADAENWTQDMLQGRFGEFTPMLDEAMAPPASDAPLIKRRRTPLLRM